MALIKCPECGQSISDKALKCPKCGYPMQESLNNKTEEAETVTENMNKDTELISDIQQDTDENKSRGKNIFAASIAFILIVAGLGIYLGLQLSGAGLTVSEISIVKWSLTDSTKYSDYYEGTIISEQEKPFIAVIGYYEDEEKAPKLVYVENGVGVMETLEDTDDDPSLKYRPIGYIRGKQIDSSDIKVGYTDSDYYDWSYSEYTSCNVLINIDMNNSETGILVFDVINETNNETEKNLTAVIVDGKTEYSYSADLPYKTRGIDISIVPKLFCKSTNVSENDYVVKNEYTAEKKEGTYYSSYSGKETLSFTDYSDGFVLYTRELVSGGNRENRNITKNLINFLCNGECTFETYDSFEKDESVLMPEYEFNVVGYITWKSLEMEAV